jgi:molybdopterin synthase catalytic subunit
LSSHADIAVALLDGPLILADPLAAAGGGAVVQFLGVVRPDETGRPLAALRYESYPPMTERELRRLAEQVASQHGLLALRCRHSVGQVLIHETSFELSVVAPHRAEAFAALQQFIDTMKREVPLWKVPEFAVDGEADDGA